MFIVIACFQDPKATNPTDNIGATYGPFDSKSEALAWVQRANFPSPEFVIVRRLYAK